MTNKESESKGFPVNLFERDLLALHNILSLAKGDAKNKTVAAVLSEVNKELEKRLKQGDET